MSNIEQQAGKMLKDLNIENLKDITKRTDILLQKKLQELMLAYVIDITEKVKLKQEDIESTYPEDLISSLKIIADLYLKMKDINKTLQLKDGLREIYVF